MGHDVMANGGRDVDTTTKDDHRRQFCARERLDHDAVGGEASGSAQIYIAAAPHHELAPHRADVADEV